MDIYSTHFRAYLDLDMVVVDFDYMLVVADLDCQVFLFLDLLFYLILVFGFDHRVAAVVVVHKVVVVVVVHKVAAAGVVHMVVAAVVVHKAVAAGVVHMVDRDYYFANFVEVDWDIDHR